MILRRAMMAGAGSSGSAVTWNPADKSPNLALSSGNLFVTHDTGGDSWSSVRATLAKSSGKWYCEFLVSLGGGTGPDMICGLANSGMTLDKYPGQDANGWGYYARDGKKVTGGVFTTYGATYDEPDVIGLAYDADAGKLWFAKNGAWQASGDPAAGSGEAFSGLPTGLFPCVSIFNTGSIQAFTGKFKTDDLTYAPPTGFSPWGG